jgi:YD repeat-containing protein
VYDPDGNPASVTAPGYTPPGATAPVTSTTVNTYDKVGESTSQSDGLTNTTHYVYDQVGDLVRTTDPAGGNTDSTFDTNGDELSETDPTGAQSQSTSDFMGRPVTSTVLDRVPTAVSSTTTSSYAASATNPGGAFLASSRTQDGAVTSYGYDNLGERTSITDAAGNTTHSTYNFLGDQQTTTLPDGTSSTVSYDPAEDPVRVTQNDASGTLLAATSATYVVDHHVVRLRRGRQPDTDDRWAGQRLGLHVQLVERAAVHHRARHGRVQQHGRSDVHHGLRRRRRLVSQAQGALDNPKSFGYGVSVGPVEGPVEGASIFTKQQAEDTGFSLLFTPTKSLSQHHMLIFPDQVDTAVQKSYNSMLGR